MEIAQFESAPFITRAMPLEYIHVKCEGINVLGFSSGFSEVWAESSQFGSQGRYVHITHYNVEQVVLGDGVTLNRYNNSTPSSAVWSSPTFPNRGLQEVNRSFLIPWSYDANLTATTTSYCLVDNLPVPFLHFESEPV